ncbi:MAG TPA: folylpolyglutamate synthase/dihydrofolate synthase family protein [Bacteroidia bacterium]|nr:folylpolyglutamate synthase/dihydrofolate synthase family protein [Bacteroidia bacterium]
MTYQETLDYLYQQLPMFHRIGPAAYKANLSNTIAITRLLDHPENDFRSVHIAGTNGKGSVSNMLAAVLQQHGYKTGLFTSPHLKDFRERIRVNGAMIPKTEITQFVKKHKEAFELISPSFFEWTAGLAFHYFSKTDVDIAVIETGMGGRLDSTNVIQPVLSVITNVQWDHMHLLGDTLKKIAAEKAGIIKERVPVVVGEFNRETAGVFRTTAKKMHTSINFSDKQFKTVLTKNIKQIPGKLIVDIIKNNRTYMKEVVVDLGGWYQLKNISTVMEALEVLNENGFEIDRKNVRKAFGKICRMTGFAGRWQVIDKHPLTIADTGHNADGIHEVMEQLSASSFSNLHMVIGMVADKDVSAILKQLPRNAVYYFCKPDLPRGYDAEALRQEAKLHKLNGRSYNSVAAALQAAQNAAGSHDLVYVGGSSFVVAEVL